MTNMQLSQSDKDMLGTGVDYLCRRRKQLCPWPFDKDETEQLFIPPNVWGVQHQLRDLGCQNLLNRDSRQVVSVDGVIKDKAISLAIKQYARVGDYMWTANRSELDVVKNTQYYPKLREWLIEAAKVKVENELTERVFKKITSDATTYKQLYKAFPESLKAVNAYNESDSAKRYYNNFPRNKLKQVMIELNKPGSSKRARQLPEPTRMVLSKYRTLVERTLAMAVMLPDHDGLEPDSQFDNTWIESQLSNDISII